MPMRPDRSDVDVDDRILPSSYRPMTKKEIFRKRRTTPRRSCRTSQRDNGATRRSLPIADRPRDRGRHQDLPGCPLSKYLPACGIRQQKIVMSGYHAVSNFLALKKYVRTIHRRKQPPFRATGSALTNQASIPGARSRGKKDFRAKAKKKRRTRAELAHL